MKGLLIFIGFFLWAAVVNVWQAFVISKLWGWFAVPLGLPIIGVAEAYGLKVLSYVLRPEATPASTSKKTDWAEVMSDALGTQVGIAILLLCGYVVHVCWM